MDDRKHSYRRYRLDYTARLVALYDQLESTGSRALEVLISFAVIRAVARILRAGPARHKSHASMLGERKCNLA
jgi:hypothetical protein